MKLPFLSAIAFCALITGAHACGYNSYRTTSEGVAVCDNGRDDGAMSSTPGAMPYWPTTIPLGHTPDGVELPHMSPYGNGRDDAKPFDLPFGLHFEGLGAGDYCHTGATRCGGGAS